MNQNISTQTARMEIQAQPDLAVAQLTRLLPSLRDTKSARDRASEVVDALSEPASMTWIMARIAALLSPYYEKDIPQGVRAMEAEDWAEAIKGKPQWAITAAVRWWKSEANGNRRKRPLEGDIMARIKVEMDAVSAAKLILSKPIERQAKAEPEARCSPEDAAERKRIASDILAAAGYRPNTFGGDQ